MLQLRHRLEAHTAATVSPHVIVRSALLELDYADLIQRIEHELQENPALDVDSDNNEYEEMPVGPPSLPAYSGSSPATYGDGFSMDSVPGSHSLQDELFWQFHAIAPDSVHELGEILISALDDDGYLSTDIFELAKDLNVPLAHVQEALEYVQQLSPSGVGARSLGECLRLQLQAKQEMGESIPKEVGQIVEHFASCYEHDIEKQLAETTELTTNQVRNALEYIRCNLHPYPGRQFHTAPSQHLRRQYIYPDAIIYYDGEDLRVKIPQSQSHELRINYAYLRLERIMKHRNDGANLDSELSDLDTQQICSIHEQIRRARRFIEMLQQRQITMKLVTEAILERQRELFTHGIMALKPLTKKQIALETGLHESTISRATRGKYVMMPSRTLLPFSIFFKDALPVKALIAQIVQQEESDHSLTDKQLAERLGQRGYPLARRTITKYRKQMGIPSSRQRDGSFSLQPVELLG